MFQSNLDRLQTAPVDCQDLQALDDDPFFVVVENHHQPALDKQRRPRSGKAQWDANHLKAQ